MKNNFLLVSMREDYFYNKKELRICIDTKANRLGFISWALNHLLISDLKTLNFFLRQSSLKINGIIITGGNDINKNSLRYKVEKRLTDISKKKKITSSWNMPRFTVY